MPQHTSVRDWFESEVNGSAAFGMAELVVFVFPDNNIYISLIESPNEQVEE